MISPDAGNLGVKAVFVWAGLLVPTTVLLWFFYPEVSATQMATKRFILTFLDLRSKLLGARRALFPKYPCLAIQEYSNFG